MQANAARLAYRYCRHQLRSPSAREEGDFALPEALNGALLAPKLTESGECRLKGSPLSAEPSKNPDQPSSWLERLISIILGLAAATFLIEILGLHILDW